MDPSERRYKLDYILIRKKWINSNTNMEAYSSFSSTGSDHIIVSSKIRLRLISNRNTLPRKIPYAGLYLNQTNHYNTNIH